MGIYISTNSKIRSFTSIACIVEVFSPDILIYFVIYLLNAMKGVRRGACLSRDWAGKVLLSRGPDADSRRIPAEDSECKQGGMKDREGSNGNRAEEVY